MTKHYIGSKQIKARPMPAPDDVRGNNKPGDPGYEVDYGNGYVSWSPKAVFEAAYLPMGEDNNGSRITDEMVADFIVGYESARMGNHTVVMVKMRNGFTIIAESACVAAENYNHTIGENYALAKARAKVWEYLGFLLATARNGI